MLQSILVYTHLNALLETDTDVLGLSHVSLYNVFFTLVAVLAIGTVTNIVYTYFKTRHIPPGPPRLPVLGNLLQVPCQFQSIPFMKWSNRYGPIFSLDILGRQIVILNDYKVASDLLERSNLYNSRPHLIMVQDIICEGNFTPMESDTDIWRRWRRATHETFGREGVEKYQHVQAEAAALAASRIITDPEGWERYIETFAASAMCSTVYGWPALEAESPNIAVVVELADRISNAAVLGNFLVDIFPLMNLLPSWMARWKREGKALHDRLSVELEKYLSDVAEKNVSGNMKSCHVTSLLQTAHQHGFSRQELAWHAAILFGAGVETISIALINFLLAMLNYPNVMRKAQNEIDEVVGRDRIPTFADADSLPYIRVMVRETLRWRPISPLGLPHVATEDNWYEGYFIPKGTAVFGNIWAMNRDPSIYPDFDTYRPERFLDKSGKIEISSPRTRHSGHTTFGFGKRICVGMHFSDRALFIAIATILWAFDVKPPLDESGNVVIPPTDQWEDAGTAIRSARFKCRFLPRSSDTEATLRSSVARF